MKKSYDINPSVDFYAYLLMPMCGYELSTTYIELIRSELVKGIVLTKDNVTDLNQLSHLLQNLRRIKSNLVIILDDEACMNIAYDVQISMLMGLKFNDDSICQTKSSNREFKLRDCMINIYKRYNLIPKLTKISNESRFFNNNILFFNHAPTSIGFMQRMFVDKLIRTQLHFYDPDNISHRYKLKRIMLPRTEAFKGSVVEKIEK